MAVETNVWQILQMYMTENGRKNPPTCNVEKYFHTHFAEDVPWVWSLQSLFSIILNHIIKKAPYHIINLLT